MHRTNLDRWILLGGMGVILTTAVASLGQLNQIKGQAAGQKQGVLRPRQPIPGPRVVQVDLETFICSKQDESLPGGDGDEPYLAVKTYWIDGSTVKLDQLSTATFRSQGRVGSHGNLGRKGVKNVDAFGIPKDLGSYEKTLIPILPAAGFPNGAPAMVGIATLAMEADQSPNSAVSQFIGDGFRKFEEEILRAIRTRSIANSARIVDAMNSFLRLRWKSIQNLNALGAVDPDDVIGTDFQMWTVSEIEAAGPRGLDFTASMYRGQGDYSASGKVRIKTVPLPRRDVTLTITQVRAVDDLEGIGRGDPDFQMRVVMDGRVFMSPEQSGKTIRPNWTFRIPALKPEIPISIELYERDSGSYDELCDLAQVKSRKSLLLRYIVDKQVVSGDRRGRAGTEIVASGVGDGDRAEIAFTLRDGR